MLFFMQKIIKKNCANQGHTLVELLVVVLIVSMLTSFGAVSLATHFRQQSYDDYIDLTTDFITQAKILAVLNKTQLVISPCYKHKKDFILFTQATGHKYNWGNGMCMLEVPILLNQYNDQIINYLHKNFKYTSSELLDTVPAAPGDMEITFSGFPASKFLLFSARDSFWSSNGSFVFVIRGKNKNKIMRRLSISKAGILNFKS